MKFDVQVVSKSNHRIFVTNDQGVSWVFEKNEETAKELIKNGKFWMIGEIQQVEQEILSKTFTRSIQYGYVKPECDGLQGEEAPEDIRLEKYEENCWMAIQIDGLDTLYFHPRLGKSIEKDDLAKRVEVLESSVSLLFSSHRTPQEDSFRYEELKDLIEEVKTMVKKEKQLRETEINKVESRMNSKFATNEIPCIQHGYRPITSSDWNTGHEGKYCIMNKPETANAVMAWVPKFINNNQHLDVIFSGLLKEVTKVQVQGRGNNVPIQYPKEIEIQALLSNGEWKSVHRGNTNLNDNNAIHTVHAKDFSLNANNEKIIAAGIRIYIRQWHNHPSMRCEVWIKGI